MKKYDNFVSSLKNLKLIRDYNEPYDTVTLTGLVGLYEICFEQAWKAMKEVLEDHGYSEGMTGSPKQILKTAFSAGMINDEISWLDALQARNNVAHSYNEAIAKDIVSGARNAYLDLFIDLERVLRENWI